jgi:hypothetical protein
MTQPMHVIVAPLMLHKQWKMDAGCSIRHSAGWPQLWMVTATAIDQTEAAWWRQAGIDPTVTARALWLETHPLPSAAHTMARSR